MVNNRAYMCEIVEAFRKYADGSSVRKLLLRYKSFNLGI